MASSSQQAAWKGDGLSQEDFMQKDQCILLDEHDQVVGTDNKYNCHRFNPSQPRGLVHRAFSVFLFDSQGRLLLQQRAKSKITFPGVWTNTCCSHPLTGYDPTEVDSPEDLATAAVPGVKRAAIRKLEHELGIPPSQVPLEKFKFLTRLHYWAADTLTHGPDSEWGEHEIDYILFIQADVTVKLNAEEVDSTRYATLRELREMMATEGLLWSPWFRIIVERFLPKWWADLGTTLTNDEHVDVLTIHRFDPPPAHMGGGGKAGPYLGDGLKSSSDLKKQGGYGKIRTHSESLVSQLLHMNEVVAALRVKFFSPFKDQAVGEGGDDVAFCDEILCKVSRSFAAVIKQLPRGLCVEIVVFYLALRALDTIEDDMEAFADPKVKIKHLQTFYEAALEDPKWSMTGVGKGDEARLLEQFYRVVRVFKSLSPGMQAVIKDITRHMGYGMAEFVGKDLGQGTTTLQEYDKYCHYVAGLVGEGLTRMFAESGLEDAELAKRLDLSNSMGLFLQKTNIIRDYLEDYVDGRAFWPQEVWKQYSTTGSLGDLAEAKNREQALRCLNHLVTNALKHVPDCLEYLSRLRTPEVYRFCAIPQVMAIATLDKVYNNENVFTGVVKIRKGLACKLILEANDMSQVYNLFACFASTIASRIDPRDPRANDTVAICNKIQSLCLQSSNARAFKTSLALLVAAPVVMAGCALQLSSSRGAVGNSKDLLAWTGMFAAGLTFIVSGGLSAAFGPMPRQPQGSTPSKVL